MWGLEDFYVEHGTERIYQECSPAEMRGLRALMSLAYLGCNTLLAYGIYRAFKTGPGDAILSFGFAELARGFGRNISKQLIERREEKRRNLLDTLYPKKEVEEGEWWKQGDYEIDDEFMEKF
jgi:hypothetical protein